MDKVINNFSDFISILDFTPGKNGESVFYLIQIIKRRKDTGNEKMETNSKIIRNYYIRSLDQYEYYKEEIINLCDNNNARAYISVNPKSQVSVAKLYAKTILDMLLEGNKEFHFNKLLESCFGKTGACPTESKSRSKWIIDIDSKNYSDLINVSALICEIVQKYNKDINPIIKIIKTLNGYHLITIPFNTVKFKEKYQKIDIHKNNDTLLYYKTI